MQERARRRRFTAEYKLRIVPEAAACTQPGEVGALLRREGLYTSHLAAWRQQRDAGGLVALGRRRGRRTANPLEVENATLCRRAERAEAALVKARKVIKVQGTSPRCWAFCSTPAAVRRSGAARNDRARGGGARW